MLWMWGEVYNPTNQQAISVHTRFQPMLTQRCFHVTARTPLSLRSGHMDVLPSGNVQIQLLQIVLHHLACLRTVERSLQIGILQKQGVLRLPVLPIRHRREYP